MPENRTGIKEGIRIGKTCTVFGRTKISMNRFAKIPVVFALSLAVSSCAVLESEVVENSDDLVPNPNKIRATENRLEGWIYALPRNDLKLTVVRKPVPNDFVKKAAAAAEKAKEQAKLAQQAEGSAKSEYEKAKKIADQATGAVKPKLQEKAQELLAAYNAAQAEKKKADQAAKSAIANANAAAALPSNVEFADDITIELLPAVGDPKAVYNLRLKHSWNREDTLHVETTEAGLLKTVTLTADDKIPEIAKTLAKIAISAFKIAAGLPTLPSGKFAASVTNLCGTPMKNIKTTPFSYEEIFDPIDPAQIEAINKKLCRLDTKFVVSVRPGAPITPPLKAGAPLATPTPALASAAKNIKTAKVDGLIYRRSLPYIVSLNILDEFENTYPIKTTQINVPNEGPVGVLPFEWAACAKNEYGVEFVSGMPIRSDVKRPSELVGCLSIPLDIVSAILALPTELIQLKVDYSSKNEELLKSQKNLFDAQKALEDAQEALEDARKARDEDTPVTSDIP